MNEAEKILEQLGLLATRMTDLEKTNSTSTEDIQKQNDERQALFKDVETLTNNLDMMKARNVGVNLNNVAENVESKEQRAALDVYLRGKDLDEDQTRSLSSIKDSDGGFLLSETQESGIVMNAFNPGEIESRVPVLPTGGNRAIIASMQKPKVSWGPKQITLTDDDLGSGIISIDIHSLRALVVIPNDTLDDSAADIAGELNAGFGRSLEEARDDAYALGSGVNQPQGFMTNKKVLANFTTTETTGVLDIDAIITAIYKLKKQYRRNAAIACNSATEGKLATLKDSQGQPLWRINSVVGAPSTFMGLPIINPEAMSDVTAGKFAIAIADFAAGYRIRERGSVSIQRLDEAFATADQTAFIVKQRIGGQTALPEAFQLVKIKA